MPHYSIGCSGFYYYNWKKYFYPEKLPAKDWFKYYTTRFNTVEINSSFYRLPRLSMLTRWYNESPEDFKFTVKAPRTITHFNKFVDTEEELKKFYDLVKAGLGEKLGTILFQLPGSITYNKSLLENMLGQMDNTNTNVIEFRNRSWWNEETYQLLKEHNVTFCSVSFPGLPTDVIKTSEAIYARFHGMPKLYYSAYNESELLDWSQKIKATAAKNVYCYFNNTAALEAIYNAYQLNQFLTKP